MGLSKEDLSAIDAPKGVDLVFAEKSQQKLTTFRSNTKTVNPLLHNGLEEPAWPPELFMGVDRTS